MGLQLSKGISWTQATLNPIVGCTKCSPGCQHCWAVSQAHIHYRKHFTTPGGKDWNGKIEFFKDRLDFLRRWRTPTMIAVGLMTDLFHPSIPDDWLDVIFRYMLTYRQHTYQILTKRHERLLQYTTGKARSDWFQNARHIWWGVTTENQDMFDARAYALLAAPVAVRYVSVEPMLGPIDCGTALSPGYLNFRHALGLDWVICGGESGHGARPMKPAWPLDLLRQCKAAGVPFHFKQWGEWAPCPLPTVPAKPWGIIMPSGHYIDWESCNGYEIDEGGEAVHRIGRELAGRLLEENEYLEFPR